MSVTGKIRDLLHASGVPFREIRHEPTKTSEESALARGEDLRIGGKALLIKVDETFRLFVLSANRKLDSAAVKAHFKARKTRFATADELFGATGLAPGSVPPFGEPILPFALYVDPSVFANPKVAFNAGSLCDSIVLATEDYRRVAAYESFVFSLPEQA